MAEQSSIDTSQPSMLNRISSFFSELETVMERYDVKHWAHELSGTFESLDLDLVREDQKDRQRPVSLGVYPCATTEAPNGLRPAHENRVRFLAQVVIKVLDNGSANDSVLKLGDHGAWIRSLNVFNVAHRKGTPLSQDQLILIARACTTVFQYPSGLPSDAYNIIADYLMAKDSGADNRMIELLADLVI